ncbi:MAG: FAD-dependent monooxygenase [Rhodospirillaceae bacterium]|nr:FAD-dependent monooxygenase [Rhodospirillaceae bacterium]MBT3534442.1 FAD-dependent monooxygenase [Rhodospirillaceae bacterium]MBT4489707.1 FAD-dependent monooxygenase [Rhodospirillaceae bacterium]MBT5898061.1 FAD-dependent monooxygenase [Rhodospirillaceae bacterium]MBT6430042.1 FAD-dependent monooxygenase [Rhodospirillaceae bacterium]
MSKLDRVIIVGAGPVGCTAALILVQQGIPVVLVEREPELAEDLRGSTFHPPTLDMLDDLGVTEQLLPQGLIAPTYQYRDRASGAYAEFDLSLLQAHTRHPYRLQCEQYKLTRTILPMLEASGLAEIRFSTQLASITQGDDSVTVEVDGPGGPQTIEGRFLIGADGGPSKVRQSMDIEFEGFTYPERFLVVTTDFPFEEHLENLSYVNYISDPVEWCVILRVPGLWRVLFPTDPDEAEADVLEPARVEGLLQGLVATDTPYDKTHITLYRVHQRVAKTYRRGNVVLAGDAAHLNNPLGGMGMNGGLHDVFNLCPKLAAIMKTGAGEDLLDLYERQRRDITIEFIQNQTIQNKKNMEQIEEEQRLQHIADLRTMIADEEQAVAFLRRNNMLDALERANAIE